jgi:hypothetical protein
MHPQISAAQAEQWSQPVTGRDARDPRRPGDDPARSPQRSDRTESGSASFSSGTGKQHFEDDDGPHRGDDPERKPDA